MYIIKSILFCIFSFLQTYLTVSFLPFKRHQYIRHWSAVRNFSALEQFLFFPILSLKIGKPHAKQRNLSEEQNKKKI